MYIQHTKSNREVCANKKTCPKPSSTLKCRVAFELGFDLTSDFDALCVIPPKYTHANCNCSIINQPLDNTTAHITFSFPE